VIPQHHVCNSNNENQFKLDLLEACDYIDHYPKLIKLLRLQLWLSQILFKETSGVFIIRKHCLIYIIYTTPIKATIQTNQMSRPPSMGSHPKITTSYPHSSPPPPMSFTMGFTMIGGLLMLKLVMHKLSIQSEAWTAKLICHYQESRQLSFFPQDLHYDETWPLTTRVEGCGL